jgi:hypothetical protein
MDGSVHRGPVEPPFGCSPLSGLRPIRETLEPVRQLAIAANEPRQPRYVAEGREVVNVHSGRRQSPPNARAALTYLVESALSTTYESLVETDLLVIADLVHAIRQAERADPTPPASIARAA